MYGRQMFWFIKRSFMDSDFLSNKLRGKSFPAVRFKCISKPLKLFSLCHLIKKQEKEMCIKMKCKCKMPKDMRRAWQATNDNEDT